MSRARLAWVSISATLVAAATPSIAHAQGKASACTAAADSAQLLRNAGKLVQAREELLVCMKSCPRIVQNDCGQWLSEVDARLPSVVFRATDARGQDVTNVRVSIDGVLSTNRFDGPAIAMDPGVHHFVFEREGNPTVVQDVNVREGEKARAIAVKFADTPKPKADVQAQARRPLFPTSSIVLGAAGLVGMGVFTVYHLSASSDLDAMRSSCAPTCSRSAVDDVDRKIVVSNVALGVGAAALAGAVVVFLLEGGWRSPAPSTSTATLPSGLDLRATGFRLDSAL